jgi:cysteine desulfurase
MKVKKSTKSIYLDFASATPVDPKILSVYVKVSKDCFGNPSALHKEGVAAKRMLENARKKVADVLSAQSDEIVFTSGGTEGDNLALFGVIESGAVKKFLKGLTGSKADKKPHIIVSSIEHAAILETAKVLEGSLRADVSYLPVDSDGVVVISELKKLLRPETVLVSVMYANNEIGTVQPIREIAKTIRHFRKEQGVFPLFHTDATQAANYLSLRVPPLGVDLMTLNGSKIYAPRGTGAFFIRRGVELAPLMHGGLQEGSIRPGTEHVAGVVSFSEALIATQKISEKESKRLKIIQEYFFRELFKAFPDTISNGSREYRLPNNVHVTFPNFSSETLMLYLDARGISVSEKSACKASLEETSHVIAALGRKNSGISGSIRFSMGRTTTKEEIKKTIAVLKEIRALLKKQ